MREIINLKCILKIQVVKIVTDNNNIFIKIIEFCKHFSLHPTTINKKFSISFEKYDKETIFLLIFLYLAYFIGTSYVYISTSNIFPNHIKSILIFSLCLGIPVLYYKNCSFGLDTYPTELIKNDNDSKILALISSFLIFLSGMYNYIIFHQQNYNELILISTLSIISYFVYTIIYCKIDKFLIYSLEKHHKKNKNFIQQLQNQEFNSKFKMQRKLGFYIFIILGIVGLYLYFFSDIPKQIHDFWNYYFIFVFVSLCIWRKFLEKT